MERDVAGRDSCAVENFNPKDCWGAGYPLPEWHFILADIARQFNGQKMFEYVG